MERHRYGSEIVHGNVLGGARARASAHCLRSLYVGTGILSL
jgi:hypothetical protein